jgi:hypothetical protein
VSDRRLVLNTPSRPAKRDKGAERRAAHSRGLLGAFLGFVPQARDGMLWLVRGQLTLWMGRDGLPARRPAASAMRRHFHDGNQKGEPTHKKMLKMKVDPNMLLKTNGREVTNCVNASILMKTSSLQV